MSVAPVYDMDRKYSRAKKSFAASLPLIVFLEWRFMGCHREAVKDFFMEIPGSVELNIDDNCGIYFLIENDSVVYVGQSVNIMGRIASHRNDDEKKFSKVRAIFAPPEKLDELEKKYIIEFNPIYNKTLKIESIAKKLMDIVDYTKLYVHEKRAIKDKGLNAREIITYILFIQSQRKKKIIWNCDDTKERQLIIENARRSRFG